MTEPVETGARRWSQRPNIESLLPSQQVIQHITSQVEIGVAERIVADHLLSIVRLLDQEACR